jgi:hypothetical protein
MICSKPHVCKVRRSPQRLGATQKGVWGGNCHWLALGVDAARGSSASELTDFVHLSSWRAVLNKSSGDPHYVGFYVLGKAGGGFVFFYRLITFNDLNVLMNQHSGTWWPSFTTYHIREMQRWLSASLPSKTGGQAFGLGGDGAD